MILVVGGAGYIGSHVVNLLVETEQVIVYDNLSTGNREAVNEAAIFIEGDLADEQRLTQVFSLFPIDAVVHVAAASATANSVENPQHYYENNVAATLVLLKVMRTHKVNNIIFSSTSAPLNEFLQEQSFAEPMNPYGRSKYFVERILEDYAKVYNMNCIVLRYLNVGGAQAMAQTGENHLPDTRLIPLILEHLNGENPEITIFEEDYVTSDGTCMRGFIHIEDLANAHALALQTLKIEKTAFTIYNLSDDQGYSIKEIIEICEQITNKKSKVKISRRREDDSTAQIANPQKMKKELGWQAEKNLQHMIEDAWSWHQNLKY
ncbi:UDP-glucose 4-epimerase GalE [Solibacillus silvestris]|uniref:UDP-glucose 4-epimerase GalE n=1 Tax=Solibacillus silvestris TaxID=76853 RepID=UPI003F7E683D